jgi:3-methylcrotonyl-CoA carboxylase alpha subunit
MEMNTRLQVEHPVTEAVTGEDLVSWQFKVAAGEALPLDQETIAQRISQRGWAIEARIYAENPTRDFMPDSGRLVHLKTPKITEDVRIDAGFIQGDIVSSAYDGMIAKLIVRGETRELAIRKLHAALEDYEVVGLSTNIEFLKTICASPDFIRGEVETGYIPKHKDELFGTKPIEPEIFVQAALGLLQQGLQAIPVASQGPHGMGVGFGSGNERQFAFLNPSDQKIDVVRVTICQKARSTFDISLVGQDLDQKFVNVICKPQSLSSISTFFPHARIESTIITEGDTLTIFQHGKRIQLTLATPSWLEKALGLKDVTNSVLAPMPCKILRNEVKEGDDVEKDQPLVV